MKTKTIEKILARLDVLEKEVKFLREEQKGAPISLPEIAKEMGVPTFSSPSASEENHILQLVKLGKKLEAIKFYREKFGVSLYEAKTAVEKLERIHLPKLY